MEQRSISSIRGEKGKEKREEKREDAEKDQLPQKAPPNRPASSRNKARGHSHPIDAKVYQVHKQKKIEMAEVVLNNEIMRLCLRISASQPPITTRRAVRLFQQKRPSDSLGMHERKKVS